MGSSANEDGVLTTNHDHRFRYVLPAKTRCRHEATADTYATACPGSSCPAELGTSLQGTHAPSWTRRCPLPRLDVRV